jgi:3-deoxy-D-manno-octulosonate 8-phosphate phosphatase (KDO 8-P phosphatase)
MAFNKEEFKRVKTFIFDVDGVLSMETTPLDPEGEPMRTANVKDGYAIRVALRRGYGIAIMTGGCSVRVRQRYRNLGVSWYYDNINDKMQCLQDFIRTTRVDPGTLLFMGDDLVDLEVMKVVGIPACPRDAVPEIREMAKYISAKKGGKGCVREVIEQVLKVQGKWLDSDTFYLRSG